jgi:hypothetical protein
MTQLIYVLMSDQLGRMKICINICYLMLYFCVLKIIILKLKTKFIRYFFKNMLGIIATFIRIHLQISTPSL